MENISLIIDILFKIVITIFIVYSTKEIIQIIEDIYFTTKEETDHVVYIYNLEKKLNKLEEEIENLKVKKGKKKI